MRKDDSHAAGSIDGANKNVCKLLGKVVFTLTGRAAFRPVLGMAEGLIAAETSMRSIASFWSRRRIALAASGGVFAVLCLLCLPTLLLCTSQFLIAWKDPSVRIRIPELSASTVVVSDDIRRIAASGSSADKSIVDHGGMKCIFFEPKIVQHELDSYEYQLRVLRSVPLGFGAAWGLSSAEKSRAASSLRTKARMSTVDNGMIIVSGKYANAIAWHHDLRSGVTCHCWSIDGKHVREIRLTADDALELKESLAAALCEVPFPNAAAK